MRQIYQKVDQETKKENEELISNRAAVVKSSKLADLLYKYRVPLNLTKTYNYYIEAVRDQEKDYNRMTVEDLKKTNVIRRKTEWYNFKALSAKSIKRGTPSNKMRIMPFSTIFHKKNYINSNKPEEKTKEQQNSQKAASFFYNIGRSFRKDNRVSGNEEIKNSEHCGKQASHVKKLLKFYYFFFYPLDC